MTEKITVYIAAIVAGWMLVSDLRNLPNVISNHYALSLCIARIVEDYLLLHLAGRWLKAQASAPKKVEMNDGERVDEK